MKFATFFKSHTVIRGEASTPASSSAIWLHIAKASTVSTSPEQRFFDVAAGHVSTFIISNDAPQSNNTVFFFLFYSIIKLLYQGGSGGYQLLGRGGKQFC